MGTVTLKYRTWPNAFWVFTLCKSLKDTAKLCPESPVSHSHNVSCLYPTCVCFWHSLVIREHYLNGHDINQNLFNTWQNWKMLTKKIYNMLNSFYTFVLKCLICKREYGNNFQYFYIAEVCYTEFVRYFRRAENKITIIFFLEKHY